MNTSRNGRTLLFVLSIVTLLSFSALFILMAIDPNRTPAPQSVDCPVHSDAQFTATPDERFNGYYFCILTDVKTGREYIVGAYSGAGLTMIPRLPALDVQPEQANR